jgi:hypothetical protein
MVGWWPSWRLGLSKGRDKVSQQLQSQCRKKFIADWARCRVLKLIVLAKGSHYLFELSLSVVVPPRLKQYGWIVRQRDCMSSQAHLRIGAPQ